jgi:hypothetical protein
VIVRLMQSEETVTVGEQVRSVLKCCRGPRQYVFQLWVGYDVRGARRERRWRLGDLLPLGVWGGDDLVAPARLPERIVRAGFRERASGAAPLGRDYPRSCPCASPQSRRGVFPTTDSIRRR